MRIIYLLFSIRGFSKPAAVKTAARTACAFSRGLRKKRAGPSELLGIMHIFPNIMRLSKIPFLRSARRPIMKGYASFFTVTWGRIRSISSFRKLPVCMVRALAADTATA